SSPTTRFPCQPSREIGEIGKRSELGRGRPRGAASGGGNPWDDPARVPDYLSDFLEVGVSRLGDGQRLISPGELGSLFELLGQALQLPVRHYQELLLGGQR